MFGDVSGEDLAESEVNATFPYYRRPGRFADSGVWWVLVSAMIQIAKFPSKAAVPGDRSPSVAARAVRIKIVVIRIAMRIRQEGQGDCNLGGVCSGTRRLSAHTVF